MVHLSTATPSYQVLDGHRAAPTPPFVPRQVKIIIVSNTGMSSGISEIRAGSEL